MPQSDISKEHINELLHFLPLFEDSNMIFAEKREEEKSENEISHIPYPKYNPAVTSFFSLVSQDCWVDSNYKPEKAKDILYSDKYIEQATLNEIKSVFTYCIRGERFSDGLWGTLLESGQIVKILRRLSEIQVLPSQGNLSIETTRKKTLEVMHKGMVSYKLANLGWDVSEHYGDGFDLLAIFNHPTKPVLAKIELKAIDLQSYKNKPGFSQSISENEIHSATHLIVSTYKGIKPDGHFILTLNQAFNEIKNKGTKKFNSFKNFQDFKDAARKLACKKMQRKKGENRKQERLALDIGCSFKKYEQNEWELQKFESCWGNLLQ